MTDRYIEVDRIQGNSRLSEWEGTAGKICISLYYNIHILCYIIYF